MADQTESYGATGKFTGVWIAPEDLVIVGLDCPDEDFPDLADPDRIALPVDDLVPSVAKHGVREAIGIRKLHGDSRVFVSKGRRRVRAARIANAELKDDKQIRIRCIPDEKGSDALLSLVIENECRLNDGPLARARKADRMRQRGDDNLTIAQTFGVTVSAVKSWWALLEAPRAAQKAVEDGKITATVAIDIAKFVPQDQAAALQAAIEAGKGSAAREAVQRMRKPRADGEERPQRIGVATLKRWEEMLSAAIAEMEDDDRQNVSGIEACAVRDALRAILGEGPRALKDYPTVQKALRTAISGGEK